DLHRRQVPHPSREGRPVHGGGCRLHRRDPRGGGQRLLRVVPEPGRAEHLRAARGLPRCRRRSRARRRPAREGLLPVGSGLGVRQAADHLRGLAGAQRLGPDGRDRPPRAV
ncbi:MAG: Antibiotic biosynthesis monooxygenase, partial [uncultured Frankineae bacterium]